MQFTGIVTDRYGTGAVGVQVQYSDTAGYFQGGNVSTDARGVFYIPFTINQTSGTSSITYTITMTDPTSDWQQSVTGSYAVNTGSTSPRVPVLYDSQGVGGLLGAYINLESLNRPVVIFVSGGYELSFLHGVSQLDPATTSFLEYLASSGFDVVAPIGWVAPNVPSFPLVIGALMKYGFGFNKIFLIGWSAGGTAAAWALTHDPDQIFNLAVIMDAELGGASETGTQTESSVFTTLQYASQVSIPNLLVWGSQDSGAISIEYAMNWVKNSKPGLTRLDPFPYSHTWAGTSVEQNIRQDINAFFTTGAVGTDHPILANLSNESVQAQLLTTSELLNATYDPLGHRFLFYTSGQTGTVGTVNMIVPKAAIDGHPIVTMDGATINPSTDEDSQNYYLYFTYAQSSHAFAVIGQNTVPEFPSAQQLVVAVILLVILLFKRGRRELSAHRELLTVHEDHSPTRT